jgi:hypothetical protein
MDVLKTGVMVAWSLMLAACGGGGGAAPAQADGGTQLPATGVAGVFDIGYGPFSGIYTLLDNGEFYGMHFVNGTELAGHPHGTLSAANSVTHLDPIAWAIFANDPDMVGHQDSGASFGRSYGTVLSVKISGPIGTYTAIANAQRGYGDGSARTLYNDALPLSALAGKYQGIMRTVGIGQQLQQVLDFRLDAGGNFSTTVVDCGYTGKLAQHASSGIFDVQVQVSGPRCRMNPALKGIVTPLSYINGVARLAVQLDSADNSQTAVFIVTRSNLN